MSLINKLKNKLNYTGNRKKVLKNVYWAVLGKIVNILSGLFVGILVARYLGPENFGLMNYVISYVTIFQVFAYFGLNNIEIRELAKDNSKLPKILGTSFILKLTFAIIALLSIYGSLIAFESDHFTRLLIIIYSTTILLSTLNGIRNFFTSIVDNEYIVKTEIIITIWGAVLKLVILYFKLPIIYFIIASSFDFMLIAIGYIISFNKKIGLKQKWCFDLNYGIYLIKQSFPLLLSSSAVIIYQKSDQILLQKMLNNEAVGLFSVASKIIELGFFLPIIVSSTISPILVKVHSNNLKLYREKSQQFMDYIFFGSLLISIFIFLLAGPAINILFGEKYIDAIPVLKIMAWKTALIALFDFSAQLIIIEGIHKFVVFRNVFACIASVIINILLIPKFGIIGSAWASIITFFISGYLAHFFIPAYRKIFQIQTNSILFGWKRILNIKK